MVLEVIYVTRHGFRSNWAVNAQTGSYTSTIPSPTGIASDPALASHGVEQALELADHLITLDPPIERFYSSPFYRCVQTLNPTLEKKAQRLAPASSSETEEVSSPSLKIRGENGLGEWYGTARFDHPSPATPAVMNSHFPRYDLEYKPVIIPSTNGETIAQLHDRTAYALTKIVEQCDEEGVKAIVICTHAATLIAIGRALTGRMPERIEEEDFCPFTCGLSKFTRKTSENNVSGIPVWKPGTGIPETRWRTNGGVAGGWVCELNGDCSFLSSGEERGWRFSGEESFDNPLHQSAQGANVDAGTGLGVVIEGKRKESNTSQGGSRL